MFIACSANRLTVPLSERGRSIIGAAQPFGYQRGFVAALDFYGREPGEFDAFIDILN
jgi:hypothetical protein